MKSFTTEEIEQLKACKLLKNVTEKAIIYGKLFTVEYHHLAKEGHSPVTCFELLGVDTSITGKARVYKFHSRYKEKLKNGYFESKDVPNERVSQYIERLEHEAIVKDQMIEFLKKKRDLDIKLEKERAKKRNTLK